MKNQLLALSAAIGVTIVGGITSRLELLPPAQAVEYRMENGILVIGVGESVRGNKTIRVRQGTKFYFKCEEVESLYDYFQIRGSVDTTLSATSDSRTGIYPFRKKGYYLFNIINTTKSYNDTVKVIVE